LQMRVCIPVTDAGSVDPRWGRADRVAIAEIAEGGVADWEEFDVQWSTQHDAGSDASHHARVARFLRDHGVEAVVADHMGPPMLLMLQRMDIRVCLEAGGDARQAVLAARL